MGSGFRVLKAMIAKLAASYFWSVGPDVGRCAEVAGDEHTGLGPVARLARRTFFTLTSCRMRGTGAAVKCSVPVLRAETQAQYIGSLVLEDY